MLFRSSSRPGISTLKAGWHGATTTGADLSVFSVLGTADSAAHRSILYGQPTDASVLRDHERSGAQDRRSRPVTWLDVMSWLLGLKGACLMDCRMGMGRSSRAGRWIRHRAGGVLAKVTTRLNQRCEVGRKGGGMSKIGRNVVRHGRLRHLATLSSDAFEGPDPMVVR